MSLRPDLQHPFFSRAGFFPFTMADVYMCQQLSLKCHPQNTCHQNGPGRWQILDKWNICADTHLLMHTYWASLRAFDSWERKKFGGRGADSGKDQVAKSSVWYEERQLRAEKNGTSPISVASQEDRHIQILDGINEMVSGIRWQY